MDNANSVMKQEIMSQRQAKDITFKIMAALYIGGAYGLIMISLFYMLEMFSL